METFGAYLNLILALGAGVAVFLILSRFLMRPKARLTLEEQINYRLQQQRETNYKESRTEKLRKNIAMAGMGEAVTPIRFRFIQLATGGLVALLVFVALSYPIVAVAAGIIGLFLPGMYLTSLVKKRRRGLNEQIKDIELYIANSIDSGKTLMDSYTGVANKRSRSRMVLEMRQTVMDIRRNVPPSQALNDMANRVGNRFLNLMVTTINNMERSALKALSENLRQQARVIDEHIIDTEEELAALAATRGNYQIMVVLIIGFTLFLRLIQPQLVDDFYGSVIGQIFFLLIAAWVYLGYWLQGRELQEPEV